MPTLDHGDQSNGLAQAAKQRLQGELATPGLAKAVAQYFKPTESFAGRTFDTLGDNSPKKITSDDLLAVTLLDVRWRPLAVRQLLYDQAGKIANLLGKIDSETDLWAEQGEEQLKAADPAWWMLRGLWGVGDTTASKLLARKRPRLIPITDSVVVTAVGTRGQTWPTLRYCFQDESFRRSVDSLRPPEGEDLSLLRIFDIAIWMLHSKSKAAKEACLAARIAP